MPPRHSNGVLEFPWKDTVFFLAFLDGECAEEESGAAPGCGGSSKIFIVVSGVVDRQCRVTPEQNGKIMMNENVVVVRRSWPDHSFRDQIQKWSLTPANLITVLNTVTTNNKQKQHNIKIFSSSTSTALVKLQWQGEESRPSPLPLSYRSLQNLPPVKQYNYNDGIQDDN
jgi:hypothetical protein